MRDHDSSEPAPEPLGHGESPFDIYPIETEYSAHVNQILLHAQTRKILFKDQAFMHEIEQNPNSPNAKLFQQAEALYKLFYTDFDRFLEWISHEYRLKCRPAAEVIAYLHKCLDEHKKLKPILNLMEMSKQLS
jgi:hypothetical protein